MSIKEGILKEIERETKNTARIISAFRDEHLDWKPHQKSMSVKALAYHVVELHNWFALALPGERFDFHKDYQREEVTTIAGLSRILEQGLEKNLEAVNRMEEQDWFRDWTLCAGEHVIAQLPKLAAMRYIIQNHLIHHRGQLSVYLRLLELPVPGIYGPSADDKRDQ